MFFWQGMYLGENPNLSIQNLNTISMSLNKKIKNTLDPNNIFGKSRVFKEF